jgi:cardiolipin synthase (CMP-forming)
MGINLATKITLLRILLTPVFLIFMIRGYPGWAILTFAVAALTDGIDGFIARTRNQKTALGSVLDPLGDKLLLTTAFIVMAIKHDHLVWIIVLIVSRDVILSIGALLIYLTGGKFEFKPNISGKITTFAQIVMVLLGLAGEKFIGKDFLYSTPFMVWAYLTAGLTIISGFTYVRKGMAWLLEQTTKP